MAKQDQQSDEAQAPEEPLRFNGENGATPDEDKYTTRNPNASDVEPTWTLEEHDARVQHNPGPTPISDLYDPITERPLTDAEQKERSK